MPYQDRDHIKKAPILFKTFVGLVSGSLATSVVHPYDLLKTRMQLSNRNLSMIPLAKCIVKHEGGYGCLYKGLSAALMRNVTNTTVRLGAFHTLSERYRRVYDKWPSLYDNIVIGIASAMLGAMSGNPAEVVLVRMMGDGRKVRPGMWSCDRYTSLGNGIKRIIKNDGVTGLWRGGLLTLLRSVMVSTVHVYCYKKTHQKQKDYYTSLLAPNQRALYKPDYRQNMKTHIVTGFVASFFTCALTLPVDLIKTRYQFVRRDQEMRQIDVLKHILRVKGVRLYNEYPTMKTNIKYGIMAGALGAFVGNPAELVLVRMMGDGTQGRSHPYQPVRYSSLHDGLKKIMCCDGPRGLWRGCLLSVIRSVIISTVQIYSYTKTHNSMRCDPKSKSKSGSMLSHFITAIISSFYASVLTLPVDLIKTWYQYLPPDPCCTQTYILKNLVQCRSVLFLWKGYLPYYLRMCTHTFITFLILDKLSEFYESGGFQKLFPPPPPPPPKKWSPWE